VKLTFQPYDLRLRHTFTIARGSRDVEPSVITMIEHDGITGYGEAAPTPRYGETRETVAAFLGKVDLGRFADPFALDPILAAVDAIAPGNTAAKASVDIALHDWIGRRLGLPLWKLWGLDPRRRLTTSFTIGIDTLPMIEQKVREAAVYPILKVKVGIPNDQEIITTIRALTDKPIRVDANEGWTSKEVARDKILWLEGQGVEFIEQPMPAAQLDDIAWLRQQVHIPIIADESVKGLDDIPRLRGAFDGINIKLMKSRGLREALRMVHTAHAMGMSVMLGCMIESSVGISAAAQLAPLAQYADLDGNVLITNDPFGGVTLEGGSLVLRDAPGLGVERR
jgi:L-alanine-DL-glutamate epimerase-like enolase superfamily enzyme